MLKSICFFFCFLQLSCIFAHTETKELFVPVSGGEIYCKVMGEGDPIVILHGGPGLSHDYLVFACEPLSKSHQLIFYDQRGSGLSKCPIEQDSIRIKKFVEDLEMIREFLGLERFSLIGHSWGAFLATNYCLSYPEFVEDLILLNPMPFTLQELILSESNFNRRLSPYLQELRRIEKSEAFMKGDLEVIKQYQLLRFLPHFHELSNIEYSEFFLQNIPEQVQIQKVIQELLFRNEFRPYDLHPFLQSQEISALILHSDDDFIPASSSRRIHESIKGSYYVELSNCGHSSVLEKPDEVYQEIERFLNRS